MAKRKDRHQSPSRNEGNEPTEPTSPARKTKKQKRKEKEKSKIVISPPVVNIRAEIERLKTLEEEANRLTALIPPTPGSSTVQPTAYVSPRPENADSEMNPPSRKGKEKATDEFSDEFSSDKERDEEEAESEDDDIEITFEALDMDRETTYGTKAEHNLVLEFENAPDIYFGDFMAPYRGLMSEMREETQATKNSVVEKMFKGLSPKKTILAATSGK